MKVKLFLLIVASFLATNLLLAQDPIVIPGGFENAGLLEKTINADTTASGERNNPNQVYQLEAGKFYIQNAPINVNNPNGTLIIESVGEGTKPVVIKQAVDGVEVDQNNIKGNFTLRGIHWQGMSLTGNLNWRVFGISGEKADLTVENCVFEFCNGIWFDLNPTEKGGGQIILRNNYWRDLHDFSQWWQARILQCKKPVDSFIMENNTITGGGLTVLGQECLFDYAVINHNTFINNHKYPFLNKYWKEVYFTNNLFVNGQMVGEDLENVATGGQDPDALICTISGVDTIKGTVLVQDKYKDADGNIKPELADISTYIFYAADNILVSSDELENYYSGGYNDEYKAPMSMLNWGGLGTGPWKVVNAPDEWHNSRDLALIKEYDNIVDENNHIYDMKEADLGMATKALSAEAADVFARWTRNMWAITGAELPTDFSSYYFGDYSPETIPGFDTDGNKSENGAGITKISDFIENFAVAESVPKSVSDGHSIGALHWNSEIDNFDSEASIAAIKEAYGKATDVKELGGTLPNQFTLEQNYPNPFNPTTNIKFSIPEASNVQLKVFNALGQEVATLVNQYQSAGNYEVNFDASNLSSGLYIYQIKADNFISSKKMMLMK